MSLATISLAHNANGESPEVVARVFGIGRTAICLWLRLPARWLGGGEGEAAFRKAAEAGRQEAAEGLQHGDLKEPIATCNEPRIPASTEF